MTFDLPFLAPVAIEDLGYTAIFFIMLLDGSSIPMTPVELVLCVGGYLVAIGDMQFLPLLTVSVLGNMIGHIIAYGLGYVIGRPLITKYASFLLLTPEHVQRAEMLTRDFGPWTAFISRVVPGLRSFASLFLGTARMPAWQFVILSTMGVTIWNTLLIVIGARFGVSLANHVTAVIGTVVAIVLGGLTITAILWYTLIKRKREKSDMQPSEQI